MKILRILDLDKKGLCRENNEVKSPLMTSSRRPPKAAKSGGKADPRPASPLANLARKHALQLKGSADQTLSVDELVADFLAMAFRTKKPEELEKMKLAVTAKIKAQPEYLEKLKKYRENLKRYLNYWEKYLQILEKFNEDA